jgi:hypothetical protein
MDQATALINALYKSDAWLCSIPHGQYETHDPYRKQKAIDLMREALAEVARAELLE